MTYVYDEGNVFVPPAGVSLAEGRCCHIVDTQDGKPGRQCKHIDRKTRMVRTKSGEVIQRSYCTRHDPWCVKMHRDIRENDLRLREADRQRRQAYNEGMRLLRIQALDAIELIANGHRDPWELAQRVMKRKPAL